MKKERKSEGWMDGRREERRERPLEFTWSDLKAGIILFSPSSSILSLLTIIYLLLRASLDSFISYNPPFSLSFSPPHRVKRKEFIFCHVFLRTNHTYKGYNERKSEKKSGGDFFSSIFYIADRFVYLLDQRLDQFHIIRYIFIPYLSTHDWSSLCNDKTLLFHRLLPLPSWHVFIQWNINKPLHRITQRRIGQFAQNSTSF